MRLSQIRRAGPARQSCLYPALCALMLLTLALPAAAAEPVAPADPLRVLASDDREVRLEVTVSAADLTVSSDGARGCSTAELPGFTQAAEPGHPQLPVKVVLLAVPPAAQLSLEVDASPARAIAETFSPCAAPKSLAPAEAGHSEVEAPPDEMAAQSGAWAGSAVRMVDLGFLRSQRMIRLEIFPFRFEPVGGQLTVSDRIGVAVRFGERALASASAPGEPEEPAFEQALERNLLNYEAGRAWRSAPAVADVIPWSPPQPGYKIQVKEDGLHQLTRQALSDAGVPVAGLNPRTLRMFHGVQEIAIRVTGEADGKFDAGDAVHFFGQATDSRYTDRNVYWLTYGGAQGKRMSGRAANAAGPLATSFLATVRKEENTVYDSDLPELPGYDHWYGQLIQAIGAGKTGSTSVSASTPQLATSGQATLDVALGAVTEGQHNVRLYVNPAANPAPVWEGSYDGATVTAISAPFPASLLTGSVPNTVKIEIVNEVLGRAADLVRVDWVELTYPRRHVADNNQLLFGGEAGSRRYVVEGFTSADAELFDVTDPLNPVLLTPGQSTHKVYLPFAIRGGATSSGVITTGLDAPALALNFGDDRAAPARYLALTPARRIAPVRIALDQPSNLQSAVQGADHIIITHADFIPAIAPLVNLRQTQGKRVKVVDVQDVYDEFGAAVGSPGMMSAEAIRDFLAYAYVNWQKPAPSSVLLVGDGTYDFRGYKSDAPIFVPPYLDMVDPDAGETATDNRFVAVTQGANGYDLLPDLDIGRLPANTAAEATAMVSKIVAYVKQAPSSWHKQVLFVADDLEGGGGNFYAYSDGIADGVTTYKGSEVKILPAEYTPKKVYLGQTCDKSNPATSTECRNQIGAAINSGSLLVSYVGHGVKTYWAAERLYDISAMTALANGGRLPVMLPMTCNEGYFIDPTEASLSELSLRRADGGAVASWSPTGYGLAPGHDYLERGLFLALFHDGVSLGAGATSAKLYLVANAPPGAYRDLIDTFLLLGDPLLDLP